jgi:hypothetical protein
LPRHLPVEFKRFFEASTLLENFAGAFLIRPEVRFCDYLLQVVELARAACSVKETSALPRYGFSPGRIAQRVRLAFPLRANEIKMTSTFPYANTSPFRV